MSVYHRIGGLEKVLREGAISANVYRRVGGLRGRICPRFCREANMSAEPSKFAHMPQVLE
jgi:hypothetical protein